MLKFLAVIGVLYLVSSPVWGQIPQHGNQQNRSAHKSSEKVAIPQPVNSPPVNAQKTPAAKQQEATAKPFRYPWREILAPANLPNSCLVVLGAWAGGMAYWTLRNIETQTSQLKIQATLMREQMDRAVARERARLSLKLQDLSIDEYLDPEISIVWATLEIINSGHSNAYVRSGAANFIAAKAGQWPLPEPDPEEFGGIDTVPPSESPEYVGMNLEFTPGEFSEFTDKLETASLRLCFYGYVEYESMGILWHRDFGYIWMPDNTREDETPFVVRHLVNKKLSLHGEWEQDVRHKNTEYQKQG